MDIIGLDLHKRESQLSIKADDGTITDRRIVTSRERFAAVFGGRPRTRILLEASTESEWVARHLESLGHEVIVADPKYAPMYVNRSRPTKTDKRDALVRTRTRYIALAKALVRRDGLRVPTSASAWVPTRIAELDLSPMLTTELEPLFAVFAPLNAQIAVADARIAAFATAPRPSLVARVDDRPRAPRPSTHPEVPAVDPQAKHVGSQPACHPGRRDMGSPEDAHHCVPVRPWTRDLAGGVALGSLELATASLETSTEAIGWARNSTGSLGCSSFPGSCRSGVPSHPS